MSRLFLGATFAVLTILLAASPIHWPLDDFAEYWAAGRLNAAGRNPYDFDSVLREEQRLGWQDAQPVMMYNPPWALALAMPMGATEFRLARTIWLPIQVLVTLWCASRLWILYGGAPRHTARVCCLALMWMPTLIALRMGQVSPVILLGLSGFLWSMSHKRDVAAGACFALTAVKPHLVALVWVPFFLWGVVDRHWKVLAGAAGCIAGMSVLAISTNPSVFAQYQHLMTSTPPTVEFESPNIATVLRVALGTTASWPQFVPTVLGAAAVAMMWYSRRAEWEWTSQLPALVLVSCLLTSYGGWAFDLVVLLVPIVATAAQVVHAERTTVVAVGGGAFVAVSLLAFLMHAARVPQSAFLWMTPTVALSSWGLDRIASRH